MGLLLGLYGLLRLLPSGGYAQYSPEIYEVGDEETVSGFVVRSERLLLSEDAAVLSTLAEGQWVGAGQQVALGYTSSQTSLTVSASGYYSLLCDGFEALLTEEALQRMTLSQFYALSPETVPSQAYGRLITGQRWYFVCPLPSGRQKDCAIGDRLLLRLGEREYSMEISRIGQTEGAEFLLVLSCERRLGEVTTLRMETGAVIFGAQEGLLVPKSALYHLDGKTGVYVLQSGRKRFKEVRILCFEGDKALVELDLSTVKGLRPEDVILLSEE